MVNETKDIIELEDLTGGATMVAHCKTKEDFFVFAKKAGFYSKYIDKRVKGQTTTMYDTIHAGIAFRFKDTVLSKQTA